MWWRSVALRVLVGWALLSGTVSAASLEQIQACLAANVPKKSSALTVKLQSRHAGGFKTQHQARIYSRRSPEDRAESLLCMTQPRDVRGLAYLLLEGERGVAVWGYLPEKHRVLQIHAATAARRARIARTAISYDDLRYLPINVSGAEPGEISDSEIAGRKVSVVGLSPPPGEDSLYARIIAFIDGESCVPLRIEFYETVDKLLKILSVDPGKIRASGGIRLGHSMTIEDLKNGVVTELEVEQVRIDPDLPETMFTPTQLQRNQCRAREHAALDSADD